MRTVPAGSSEDSSSSSSGEEDEDEGASLESTELGLVRYDDTTCPPGCSENLYEMTLELRAQR